MVSFRSFFISPDIEDDRSTGMREDEQSGHQGKKKDHPAGIFSQRPA
jgi:hypothetical protein